MSKHLVRVHDRLRAINDGLNAAIVAAGAVLILLFLIGVFLDVAVRVVGITISWMQEVTTFVFVWAVFLGATVIFRPGIMYTIDILPESLPAGISRVLRLLVVLIDAFCIFVLFRFGVDLAVMGVGRISQPSGIRIVYAFASIPISAAFMLLFLVEIALRNLLPKEGR